MNEVKKYTNNLNFSFNNNILCTLDDCLWYDQKTNLLTGENMMYCNLCNSLQQTTHKDMYLGYCHLPHLIFNSGNNNCYNERIYLDQYYKTPDGDYLQLVSFEVNTPGHFISFHKVLDGNNNYKWYMFDDTNGKEEIVTEGLINQLLHYQYNGTLGKHNYHAPFTVYTADYQPIARKNGSTQSNR